MDSSTDDLRGPEFWKAHVLSAEKFSGTYAEYCESNGLSKSTFHANKRRLGFTRAYKPKRSAFVEVTPADGHFPEPPKKRSESRLPDPKWFAEVLMAMGASDEIDF